MSEDRALAAANLRVVAAVADKLAKDLEAGRLWEGEFSAALGQIETALRHMPKIR